MSHIHTTIYPTLIESDFDPRCLSFVTAKSFWSPARVTGPARVLELYGIQLALDFLKFESFCDDPIFDRIVRDMPSPHGPVELAFLHFIARRAAAGAR